jgi:hypothetical protein
VQAEREGGALRGAIDAGLGLPWGRVWRPFGRACAWVMGVPFWAVFAVLLVGQWLVVGIVALAAAHNGFSYYSGGDDSWYYTSAWVLGHGHIPYAGIGYGYPILLAPLALLGGPNIVAGLPLVVAFNQLVLWPVALLCVYGIAKAIGGRGYAYLATLAWVVFPLISIPYFYGRYHVKLVDQTLPLALGLNVMGDFPSLVLLLVAAYFALVAIDRGGLPAAVASGLAAGLALTIKPSNLIFLPAPLLALAAARRPRELAAFALALVPALAGLTLWKYRGLGTIPAFQSAAAVALGRSTPLPPLGSLTFHRYLPLDWGALRENMYQVREFTWSLRMITWALVAGVIALWRRSAPAAVLFGGWLACFVLLKASSTGVSVRTGSFFRYMEPAFPPFFFGLVALPLLVPVFGRRLAALGRAARSWPETQRAWKVVLGVAGAALAVPVLAIAALPPLRAPEATRVPDLNEYVPVNSFPLVATPRPGMQVRLRWPSQDAHGARASYVIFREARDGLVCLPVARAAADCTYFSTPATLELTPLVGPIHTTSFVDEPGAGTWIYRVAAMVSPNGPATFGNYTALSDSATATLTG